MGDPEIAMDEASKLHQNPKNDSIETERLNKAINKRRVNEIFGDNHNQNLAEEISKKQPIKTFRKHECINPLNQRK